MKIGNIIILLMHLPLIGMQIETPEEVPTSLMPCPIKISHQIPRNLEEYAATKKVHDLIHTLPRRENGWHGSEVISLSYYLHKSPGEHPAEEKQPITVISNISNKTYATQFLERLLIFGGNKNPVVILSKIEPLVVEYTLRDHGVINESLEAIIASHNSLREINRTFNTGLLQNFDAQQYPLTRNLIDYALRNRHSVEHCLRQLTVENIARENQEEYTLKHLAMLLELQEQIRNLNQKLTKLAQPFQAYGLSMQEVSDFFGQESSANILKQLQATIKKCDILQITGLERTLRDSPQNTHEDKSIQTDPFVEEQKKPSTKPPESGRVPQKQPKMASCWRSYLKHTALAGLGALSFFSIQWLKNIIIR